MLSTAASNPKIALLPPAVLSSHGKHALLVAMQSLSPNSCRGRFEVAHRLLYVVEQCAFCEPCPDRCPLPKLLLFSCSFGLQQRAQGAAVLELITRDRPSVHPYSMECTP